MSQRAERGIWSSPREEAFSPVFGRQGRSGSNGDRPEECMSAADSSSDRPSRLAIVASILIAGWRSPWPGTGRWRGEGELLEARLIDRADLRIHALNRRFSSAAGTNLAPFRPRQRKGPPQAFRDMAEVRLSPNSDILGLMWARVASQSRKSSSRRSPRKASRISASARRRLPQPALSTFIRSFTRSPKPANRCSVSTCAPVRRCVRPWARPETPWRPRSRWSGGMRRSKAWWSLQSAPSVPGGPPAMPRRRPARIRAGFAVSVIGVGR